MIAEKILTGAVQTSLRKSLTLQPFDISFFPEPEPDKKYMLYIHIPFCKGLCPYCSFNRFLFEETTARSYFKYLRQEIEVLHRKGFNFESMYIGGGTPTILINELVSLIDYAKSIFDIKKTSCETNPNHLTESNIDLLAPRIDRLSVGIQSFDDGLLKQMHRYQRFGPGELILRQVKNAVSSFQSLNIDMIFNLPNQTENILREDINKIINSGAHQATFYPLMTSPSVDKAIKTNIGKIDYSREKYFYDIIMSEMRTDFKPTTAWTFSRKKPNMIDEYIIDYEEYIGTGSGSFSYINGCLFVNHFSLQHYKDAIVSGKLPVYKMHKFDKQSRMRYTFMKEIFGLELNKQDFKKKHNIPINIGLWDVMLFMNFFRAFSENSSKKIKLSNNGGYFAVLMMQEFFSDINLIRDQARKALSPSEIKLQAIDD